MSVDEARQEIRRMVYKEHTGDVYVLHFNHLVEHGISVDLALDIMKDLYMTCVNDYGLR